MKLEKGSLIKHTDKGYYCLVLNAIEINIEHSYCEYYSMTTKRKGFGYFCYILWEIVS